MAHRLPSQGAFERLEPYAGKLARTVLRGEWRSNAPFLPDKPNGNGAAAQSGPEMAGQTGPDAAAEIDPEVAF